MMDKLVLVVVIAAFSVHIDADCVDTQTSDLHDNAAAVMPANFMYVGPWFVGDNDTSTIEIDIAPDSQGFADDVFIWLTEHADKNSIGDSYGILLDYNDANAAPANQGDRDSVVTRNGLATYVGNINDVDGVGGEPDVVTTAGEKFTLQYTRSTGGIKLVDQSDTNKQYSTSDSAASKVNAKHLFVSSGNMEFASWKVCGLYPRKLPTVGAESSDWYMRHVGDYSPAKAIDGNKNPDVAVVGGCFISSSDTPDPWLQIDLGKEYDVKLVLIYPIDNVPGLSDPGHLTNADVYVGSCLASSLASIMSNNKCNVGIVGGVDVTGKSVIEIPCLVTSYGRYVYILHDTTANAQINLCEVEVYGDDVPNGKTNEATIQFSAATCETANDE